MGKAIADLAASRSDNESLKDSLAVTKLCVVPSNVLEFDGFCLSLDLGSISPESKQQQFRISTQLQSVQAEKSEILSTNQADLSNLTKLFSDFASRI